MERNVAAEEDIKIRQDRLRAELSQMLGSDKTRIELLIAVIAVLEHYILEEIEF